MAVEQHLQTALERTEWSPMSLLRHLYSGWMAIVGRFGAVQTLVLLAFFYAALIGPARLGTLMARRDLLDKGHLRESGSAWHQADSSPPDLERAKLTT